MRIVLILSLAFNFLVEGPVGAFLVFAPESFLSAGQTEGILWARNYGVAALAVASMIFWVWPHRDNFQVLGVAIGFLMVFHCALTAALLTTGGQQVGAILHSILTISFTFLYFQRAKWCSTERG
jgi:hypothetical protein